MRIGTSLAEPQGPQAISKLRDQLLMAVDDGYSSAWMANIFGVDALTALAAAGYGVHGIEMGT
ncbi:MAG: LLM class F420-dependent oxidoreductase, partial [Nocardiopsaceae bacterium]|nr:LLM class F420-dependent oxidoreductase [Nocardiopsaceae bacterium]